MADKVSKVKELVYLVVKAHRRRRRCIRTACDALAALDTVIDLTLLGTRAKYLLIRV